MLTGQLTELQSNHARTQRIQASQGDTTKKQAQQLNETLKNLRGKLVEAVQHDSKRKSVKENGCGTDPQLSSEKKQAAKTASQCMQTEEYLMYQMVEEQLKHVYESVNKLKTEEAALKGKYSTTKGELKAEKEQKQAIRQQLESVRSLLSTKQSEGTKTIEGLKAEMGRLEAINAELRKLNTEQQAELDKYEKGVIAAEFKVLQLQEELESKQCKKSVLSWQQQTTPPGSPRQLQPTILLSSFDHTESQMERAQTLQYQIAGQVEALSIRIQSLTHELAQTKRKQMDLSEQLQVETKTVRALQRQLKNCLEQISISEYETGQLENRHQRALAQVEALTHDKKKKEGEMADALECLVKEKTNLLESKKRQVEQQFIEMERSYRSLFEQNIEMKRQLSQSRSCLDELKKSFREKECQFNIEVSAYEKKIHEHALKRCDCEFLRVTEEARNIATARLNQQRTALEKHLEEVNSEYLTTKQQLADTKALNSRLEKQATQKLRHLASKYEQMAEYNELLLAENAELKKNRQGHPSSSKENERMRKLYLSIWKERFTS